MPMRVYPHPLVTFIYYFRVRSDALLVTEWGFVTGIVITPESSRVMWGPAPFGVRVVPQ